METGIALVVLNVIIGTYVARKWFHSYNLSRVTHNTKNPLPQNGYTNKPVSVIVPAWNEATVITATINSLQSVVYPQWEVIIVAGGNDKTYDIALTSARESILNIRIISQNTGGKNTAINQGLEIAKHEIIVILDADTIVTKGWLSALVDPLSDEVVAICGNYFPVQNTWVSSLEQMEKISAYHIYGQTILQGSGSIAIYRKILQEIGGLPENIRIGVDWELSSRLSRHGYKTAFADSAHVLTHRPTTLNEYIKNEIRWRRAHLQSIWIYRHQQSLIKYLTHYVISLLPIVGMSIYLLLLILHTDGIAGLWIGSILSVEIWLGLSRSAIVIEVYQYTRERKWLLLFWVPAFLLYVSYIATWCSLITIYHIPVHFKGPRHDLGTI